MESADKIDKFVEDFFYIPYKIDFDFDEKTEEKRHKKYLKEKYSSNILKKYDEISDESVKNPTEENYHKLNEFAFRTGLYLDGVPETALRTKETLRLLLNYFLFKSDKKQDSSLTIVDYGSGDSQIDVGLATYLENLKKIYLIEMNKEAINLTKYFINKNSAKYRKNLADKIQIIKGDYRKEQVLEEMLLNESLGVDVAFTAYPFSLSSAMKSMDRIIKKNGIVLSFLPIEEDGQYPKEILINSILGKHEAIKIEDELNLNFKGIANLQYTPNATIVLTEGKRSTNINI